MKWNDFFVLSKLDPFLFNLKLLWKHKKETNFVDFVYEAMFKTHQFPFSKKLSCPEPVLYLDRKLVRNCHGF